MLFEKLLKVESFTLSQTRTSLLRPSASHLFEKKRPGRNRLEMLLDFVNGSTQNVEGPVSKHTAHSMHRGSPKVQKKHSMRRLSPEEFQKKHLMHRLSPEVQKKVVGPALTKYTKRGNEIIKQHCTPQERTLFIRKAEWHAWDKSHELQTLKMLLKVLGWWSVTVYTIFPLVFCVGYGIKFSKSLTLSWVQQAAVNLIFTYAFTEFISILLSVIAGWVYARLYPRIRALLQKMRPTSNHNVTKIHPVPIKVGQWTVTDRIVLHFEDT